MYLRHLLLLVRVPVDVLDGGAPMVLRAHQPLAVVIVELHGKLAWLKGPHHLPEGVIGVTLLPAANDKAARVVGHELQVAKLHDPVTGVVAEGGSLARLRDRDNVAVHVVAVDPRGLVRAGLDDVDL